MFLIILNYQFHCFHNLILLKILIMIICQLFLVSYSIKIVIKYKIIFQCHQYLLINCVINLNLLTIRVIIIKVKQNLLNYCLVLGFQLCVAIFRSLTNCYRIN